MKALTEVGARIAASRKSLRFEKRFFCPHDSRLVAALVPFEGQRYLWIVGGEDQHAQRLGADLFESLTALRNTEEWHRQQSQDPEEYDRLHAQLIAAYREISEDGKSDVPSCAYALNDAYYRSEDKLRALGHGFEPIAHYAPCPRCHRSVVLHVIAGDVVKAPDSSQP